MTSLLPRIRVAGAGLALCGLALAACGPVTPDLAAETPFVPTRAPTSAAATNTAVPPTVTTAPEAYPPATDTVAAPGATATLASYPATQAATEDPYEAGQPTATVPSEPTATTAPMFITYRDFEIVPASSIAKVGQQVVFLIQSGSGAFHQPYAGAAAPFIFEAPPDMGNGVSWPITFSRAQTLTILCGYHGNMTATLTIEP